jgi:hypothetical protein
MNSPLVQDIRELRSTHQVLTDRRAEIEACTQDWMREDRLAQIDKEIRELAPSTSSASSES